MKHQAPKQNNIFEKLVDLKISIKSLSSSIITYYASSLLMFTRSREKLGGDTGFAYAERTKSLKFC